MFFRVHIFQSPGFSGSSLFKVQVYQDTASGPRFFRVRVQGPGLGFRSSHKKGAKTSWWLKQFVDNFYYFNWLKFTWLKFALDLSLGSSHQNCSVKKGVLKFFVNLRGKDLCWSLFFLRKAAFDLSLNIIEILVVQPVHA